MIIFEDKKDSDFMSELEAASRLKPAKPALLMMSAIMALFTFAIMWAAFAKVEIIAKGQGQVVPSREIQVVQSLEGGILGELLVKEGEQVKKDQILMRIRNPQVSSDEGSAQAKFLSLSAKKARLDAEAKGEEFKMPADIAEKYPSIAANETALYKSRQDELKNAYSILDDKISKATAELAEVRAQASRLAESKGLLSQELEITRKMVAERASPKVEQLKLEREMADMSGQMAAAAERAKGLEAELQEAKKQKETQAGSFRSQALTDLGSVEAELATLSENLKSSGDKVNRAEVRSPVDGIVNKIGVSTIGGVIEPAMRLAEIVPVDDQLKIVAKIPPEQMAFLKVGQKAKVKITAYDAQKYGALSGELVRIGSNSVTDREGHIFFELEVRADKNHMGTDADPLPITPGMVANVEVITGRRAILEYLLKPVLRARGVALTER